jgi:predicted Rossmann fold nucleotide-binding protein DprA/Smf involved in DNA uptake
MANNMKVIIAGGRSYSQFYHMIEKMDLFLSNCENLDIEIVSGTASGADKLGEDYADLREYKIKRYICTD